jgi:hypothetical protein
MKNYGYCLTINNPTDSDFVLRKAATEPPPFGWSDSPEVSFRHKKDAYAKYPLLKDFHIDYLLIGLEFGKKGTKHYQMVVVFNKPKSLGQVKKIWPRAHIEYMKGTLREATAYITDNKEKESPKYYRAYIGKIEDIERRIEMDKEYLKVINDSHSQLTDLSTRTAKIEDTMDKILGLLKEQHTSNRTTKA